MRTFARALVLPCLALGLVVAAGCTPSRRAYAEDSRIKIDRRGIDFPAGLELSVAAKGFTAPSAVA